MHPGIRNRISFLFGIMRIVFHWGYIPAIIYFGFQQGADPGMPQFSLLSLLWQ